MRTNNLSCLFTVLLLMASVVANAAKVDVKTPGTLQSLILDLESTTTELVISGALNSQDLSYINSGKGKIASFSILDLSAVRLSYDGGLYAEYALGNSDIGMGTYSAKFVLSNECKIDTVSNPTGLGGGIVTYTFYSNNLAGAFIGNKNFKKIKLPDCIDSIGEYIFRESTIESVDLPSQINIIPKQSFYNTQNLTELSLPNIIEIEDEAFFQSSISKLHTDNLKKIGCRAFYDSAISLIELSNVESLGERAFWGCSHFQASINLESLSSIPNEAFRRSAINGVKFSPNLTCIGDWAFDECNNIRRFDLPDGLISIGTRALNWNGTDIVVNIPNSVTLIGENALPQNWVYQQPYIDGIWYFGQVAYQFNKAVTAPEILKIKDGTVSVSVGLISDNYSLKSAIKTVILPSSLRYLGTVDRSGNNPSTSGIFTDCTALETINLPDGLEILGDGVFRNCQNLKIETWPSSIKAVGRMAFYGCKSLSSVSIPEECEFVGHQAFLSCEALYKVEIFAKNLQTYTSSPFEGNIYNPNESVEIVTFGPKVETIPNNLFSYCTNLVKVEFMGLPGHTTRVSAPLQSKSLKFGSEAFSNCKSLKTISIPHNTVEIGINAFDNVPLNTIHNFMSIPLDVASSKILQNGNKITVYVPEGSFDLFKSDAQWNKTNLVAMQVESGIENIFSDIDSNQFIECYNINGSLIFQGKYSDMHLDSGIFIIKYQNKSFKIYR